MELHFQRLLAIALGGAAGAVCRYGVALACVRLLGPRFPTGVLLVNVAGCYLLGVVMHDVLVANHRIGTVLHSALTVGFLGAMTTFSTFGYDTLRLWELGRPAAAAANVVANCGLGLAACWLGKLSGDWLWNS